MLRTYNSVKMIYIEFRTNEHSFTMRNVRTEYTTKVRNVICALYIQYFTRCSVGGYDVHTKSRIII